MASAIFVTAARPEAVTLSSGSERCGFVLQEEYTWHRVGGEVDEEVPPRARRRLGLRVPRIL
jgi:hypothetical protein